jgi:phosphoribosylformimino-5-aminoimidazole carboxamide ribotide isomerase
MDLLGGQAVHAVRGERAHYQPIKSVLCNASDPIVAARAFRCQLGLYEIYIADLDGIQGFSHAGHREVISILSCQEKMKVILDSGVPDAAGARAWLDIGVDKVVIGSETLRSLNALRDIPEKIDAGSLVFSLDMRGGEVLSLCSDLAVMTPLEVLGQLHSAGWREVILLDLKRVGSSEGVDYALASAARAKYPDLDLLIGGGVSKPEELIELKALGVAGVLAATALHEGKINAMHLGALR